MESFSNDFQTQLTQLMRLRRDVRRFRTDPVDEALVTRCLDTFRLAPSVGLSEPWRILRIRSADARAAVLDNFKSANASALDGYDGDRSAQYSRLKLTGMQQAPVQLAVYCDDQTTKGHGLGKGWVSILEPARLARDLDVPAGWALVAYLCLGWPEDVSTTPELETLNWEKRRRDLPIETR